MHKRKNGEGTWGKKKIGKYVYNYYRDSNGTYTYGKTLKTLKQKLEDKQSTSFVFNKKTTFGEYISNWLDTKESSIEQSTYSCYVTIIHSMILNFKYYDIANKQMGQLNSEMFQTYLNTLADHYSRSSISKVWIIIRQCIKYAEINNQIQSNTTTFVKVPIESKITVKKKDIPFLSLSDTEKLYNASKIQNGKGSRIYGNYSYAIILILYTGMRVSEMVALKWKNVDIKNKCIFITESHVNIKDHKTDTYVDLDKAPKTEDSIRKIPLPDRAMESILFFDSFTEHGDNDYVCVTSAKTIMGRRNINRSLNAIAKRGNLDVQDFSIHTLRHTYATTLLNAGVDIKTVSKLLGHKDVTTTYNIYVGVDDRSAKEDIEKVFNN